MSENRCWPAPAIASIVAVRFVPWSAIGMRLPTKSSNPGMTPLRGELWWVRLGPTVGSEVTKTRPCVVVGSNTLNQRRRTVLIVPLSTGPSAAPPLTVSVASSRKAAVAVIDQVRAAAKQRFVRRAGTITATELTAIEDGLRAVMEL
jgi:mRNA interferase MazF